MQYAPGVCWSHLVHPSLLLVLLIVATAADKILVSCAVFKGKELFVGQVLKAAAEQSYAVH